MNPDQSSLPPPLPGAAPAVPAAAPVVEPAAAETVTATPLITSEELAAKDPVPKHTQIHAKIDQIEREAEKWLGGRAVAIKKLLSELREHL